MATFWITAWMLQSYALKLCFKCFLIRTIRTMNCPRKLTWKELLHWTVIIFTNIWRIHYVEWYNINYLFGVTIWPFILKLHRKCSQDLIEKIRRSLIWISLELWIQFQELLLYFFCLDYPIYAWSDFVYSLKYSPETFVIDSCEIHLLNNLIEWCNMGYQLYRRINIRI